MPKRIPEMSDKAVRALSKPGFHRVGGVPGLGIKITPSTSKWDPLKEKRPPPVKTWVFRFQLAGQERDMGLGALRDVSLSKAREKSRAAREMVAEGIDPIREAKERLSALAASRASDITFKECAESYMKAHEAEWSNAKHRSQWESTLRTYAYPEFGNVYVRDVSKHLVLKVLEPIWTSKNETARRLRTRIYAVLDMAIAKDHRPEPNPARWQGGLKSSLPAIQRKQRNHPAVPVERIAEFMGQLRQKQGTSARALELLVLTALRSSGVRLATWSEFNLKQKVWTIPAERMKAKKVHQVPLSRAAIELINAQPRIEGTDYVFPSSRTNGALSDMALLEMMRELAFKDETGQTCVPHGLRSTFTDWCGDYTDWNEDVSEAALAHTIGNATRAAYRRRKALQKRRLVMEEWATFCATPYVEPESAEVIELRAA
jgi:integrase